MSQTENYAILIVEDDIEVSGVLAEITSSLGYKPYNCFNGRQALDLIIEKKIEPVLVICDINMPEMSGLEFVQYQLAKNLNLNICMLTADSSSEVILQALKLGVIDYICKPFSLPVLTDKIATLAEIGKNKLKIKVLNDSNPEVNKMRQNENMLSVINSSKKSDD